MKLTTAQLKKIIAEEVKKATLKEAFKAGPLEPAEFYKKKRDMLSDVILKLESAALLLEDIGELDERSPEGEDADIRSASMDLSSLVDFVSSIQAAVDAMVPR